MATIGSTALSLLQGLTSSSSLVSLLSGNTSSSTTSAGDSVGALLRAEKSETTAVAKQAKQSDTKRDIDRYTAVLAKAKDLKTLLADPIARKVFLTANGLGDQTDYPALAVKALSSDVTKTGNLASTLTDTDWASTAKAYSFATKGLAVLKEKSAVAAVSSGYAEVEWRKSLDKTTPGLSAALDFRKRAATVKNVDQILGDSNLRTVVTTALGIPLQIAYQPLEAQEKAITTRLDLAKLKDPKFVEQFTRRFLVAKAAETASSDTTGVSLLS